MQLLSQNHRISDTQIQFIYAMQDLGAQIKQFIHLQLKDGNQNANLLSNTMLYAFDLASSDDFFDYYKTLAQPEPADDPDTKAMFYAQKIVDSLIEELEKKSRDEPKEEPKEPVKRTDEPIPHEEVDKNLPEQGDKSSKEKPEDKAVESIEKVGVADEGLNDRAHEGHEVPDQSSHQEKPQEDKRGSAEDGEKAPEDHHQDQPEAKSSGGKDVLPDKEALKEDVAKDMVEKDPHKSTGVEGKAVDSNEKHIHQDQNDQNTVSKEKIVQAIIGSVEGESAKSRHEGGDHAEETGKVSENVIQHKEEPPNKSPEKHTDKEHKVYQPADNNVLDHKAADLDREIVVGNQEHTKKPAEKHETIQPSLDKPVEKHEEKKTELTQIKIEEPVKKSEVNEEIHKEETTHSQAKDHPKVEETNPSDPTQTKHDVEKQQSAPKDKESQHREPTRTKPDQVASTAENKDEHVKKSATHIGVEIEDKEKGEHATQNPEGSKIEAPTSLKKEQVKTDKIEEKQEAKKVEANQDPKKDKREPPMIDKKEETKAKTHEDLKVETKTENNADHEKKKDPEASSEKKGKEEHTEVKKEDTKKDTKKEDEEAAAARAKKLLEEQKEAEERKRKLEEEELKRRREWEAKEEELAEKLKKDQQEAAFRLKKLEEEEVALKNQRKADEKAANELAEQRKKDEIDAQKKLLEAEAASKRLKEEAQLEAQRKKEEAEKEAKWKREEADREAKLKKEEAELEAERRKREADSDILKKKEEFDELQKLRLAEAEKLANLKREEVDREAKQKQEEAEKNALRIKQEAEEDANRKHQEAELSIKRAKDEAEKLALKRKEEAETEAKKIREAATAEANRIKEEAIAQAKKQIEQMEKEAQKRKQQEEKKALLKRPEQKDLKPVQTGTKPKPQQNGAQTQLTDTAHSDRTIDLQIHSAQPGGSNYVTPHFNSASEGNGTQAMVHENPEKLPQPSLQSKITDDEFKSFPIGTQFISEKKIESFDSQVKGPNNKREAHGNNQKVQPKPIGNKMVFGGRGPSKINNLVSEPVKENGPQAEHSAEPIIKQKFNLLRTSTPAENSTGTRIISKSLNSSRPNVTVSSVLRLENHTPEDEKMDSAENQRPFTTANIHNSYSHFGADKKAKGKNGDSQPSSRFTKQIQSLPIKPRENGTIENKSKQLIEIKPKTRERLAPINKSTAREADPFAVPNANNFTNSMEDPLRDISVFKKQGSGKGEFKILNGKTINNILDSATNPYGPTWTKWVLRTHYDVSMEAAVESHGLKWKIRRIKNLRRKSPDHQHHEDRFEQGSPMQTTTKSFLISGGNKRNGKQKARAGKNKFFSVEDLPLGVDLVAANIFVSQSKPNILDQNNENYDNTWLADTLTATWKIGNSRKTGSSANSIEVQPVTELPIFHIKFLSNLEVLKQAYAVKQLIIENQPLFVVGLPWLTKATGSQESKKE